MKLDNVNTETARATLVRDDEFTCVLCGNGTLLTDRKNGIRPLLGFADGKKDFSGFSAADKIVGRAAAFMFVLLGVTDVYGEVMSEGGLAVLMQYGIGASYDKLVPYIVNRAGDGVCPMELAVRDCETPREAYEAVARRLRELNGGK